MHTFLGLRRPHPANSFAGQQICPVHRSTCGQRARCDALLWDFTGQSMFGRPAVTEEAGLPWSNTAMLATSPCVAVTTNSAGLMSALSLPWVAVRLFSPPACHHRNDFPACRVFRCPSVAPPNLMARGPIVCYNILNHACKFLSRVSNLHNGLAVQCHR